MEHEEIMPGEEEKNEGGGEKDEEDRELIIGDNLEVKTKKLDKIERKWDEHEKND